MTHPYMIAIVALAPSEVSYYDNKTGIRLNAANRYAPILKDMDLTNIRRSVKVGRLMLVNGVLPAGEQKQGVLGKILKSSNYDMVAPGIVTEEAVNKALAAEEAPEFDVDAALKEAEKNAKEVVEESVVEDTTEEVQEEVAEKEVEETTTEPEVTEELAEKEQEEVVEELTEKEAEVKEEAPKKTTKKKTSTKKTTKK